MPHSLAAIGIGGSRSLRRASYFTAALAANFPVALVNGCRAGDINLD
jgi:hypothetical protein